MAVNYRKCPKCGSSKVIKILYGMPTYESFQLAEEGKIKLGGCCITGLDPEYFCKDCENEWDRQTVIDSAYNSIQRIKASVGGYFGGYYEVKIDFSTRKLRWTHLGVGTEDYYEKIVRQSNLDKFIEELKIINLLKWKSKYIESDICDGTQWSIEIVKDGRKLKKYGDNKFPEEWDNFCRLIRKVSDKGFS